MYDITKDAGYIRTVTTVLNENENGGESVIVTTHVLDNGDHDENSRYTQTTISLHSYGRSAELNLGDVLDCDALDKHILYIPRNRIYRSF